MFEGTITAMITPFSDQKIDEAGFIENIHFQIDQGVNGLLLLGTTGESPTLSEAERWRLVSLAVREAKGKVSLIVGTGENCTQKTIENTKKAYDFGADAVSIINPYYNKPSQEGIFRHFEAIATQTDLPILVYNNPGRAATNIETSTLNRIAGLPNICGVKESSGNINQVGDILYTIGKKYPSFTVLSGDDILTFPLMALGGHGVVSVLSNLLPSLVCELVNAAKKGDFYKAQDLHYKMLPANKVIFVESNPIPIKAAMNLFGMAAGDCRLPLCKLSETNQQLLQTVFSKMEIPLCVR